MELKEQIAEALYNHYISTIYDLYPSWDVLERVKKVPYYKEAEAVIKALEAPVPKELMDCLLSNKEWESINRKAGLDVIDIVINLDGRYTVVQQVDLIVKRCNLVAKAQLQSPKLQAYIEAVVKARTAELVKLLAEFGDEIEAEKITVIKAINNYYLKKISLERCAEILDIPLDLLIKEIVELHGIGDLRVGKLKKARVELQQIITALM